MRASSLPRAAIFVALLALAGSALPAPSAEAQTTTVPQHVSNLGQTDSGATGHLNDLATSFRTGGTTNDIFTLTSVVLQVESLSGTVRIQTSTGSGDAARPYLSIGGNLVKQGSATSGQITFNAPPGGISLVGGTLYWVRTTHASDNNLRQTSSDNEDAGRTSGWSIGDVIRYRTTSASSWTTSPNALRLRINATGPPPVDRTVNALADAWGLTESAPASEPEDAWDGSARNCRHNGRGYYNLAGAPARWHGLGMGCHTHGQGHHEHGREKH